MLKFLKYILRNRDIFANENETSRDLKSEVTKTEMASDKNPPYVLIDERGLETLLSKISGGNQIKLLF